MSDAAGGFFKAVLSYVPWRWLWRQSKAIDLPPAEGTHFTVLLADLGGDGDSKQTRHVELAFRGRQGLALARLGVTLSEPDHGHLAEGRQRLEEDARRWLREKNADILVYGEVRRSDEVLWLRFLPREPDAAASKGDSYRLTTEKLELPVDFHDEFNSVLVPWCSPRSSRGPGGANDTWPTCCWSPRRRPAACWTRRRKR